MRHIFYGTAIYFTIGFMLVIYNLPEKSKQKQFNPFKALIGWLPGLFSKKIAKWIAKG